MLTPGERRRGTVVVCFMLVNAMLDFFSLASFLPLIVLLVNPDALVKNPVLLDFFRLIGSPTKSNFIISLAAGALAFTIIKNVIGYWITRNKAAYIFNIGSELSRRALSKYMEISYLTFTQVDFTKELDRITNKPLAFANNIVMPLAVLISEAAIFLLLLSGLIIYDFRIFIFVAAILIPTAWLYVLKRKRLEELSAGLKVKYPLTMKYALQVVEGLPEITIFSKQTFFQERFSKVSKDLAKTFAEEHTVQTGTMRMTEIVAAVIICTLIIFTVLTSHRFADTVVLLSVYAAASFRLFPSMNRMLNASIQLRTHAYLFQELIALQNHPVTTATHQITPMAFDDYIELKDVSYQYVDGLEVLKKISFKIHKGEKIALVGKSGSGKTTLLMILLQFLDSEPSTISIDGIDLNKNDAAWKKLFTYVPQNPYILDGTILENIAWGCFDFEIDHYRVKELLHILDLDGMVSGLPDGVATRIGERGVKLSGGQRQRIAIARALYADAPILILDEITNQLDKSTEEDVLERLSKFMKDRTVIMITHHQDIFKKFDRVLTLNNGTIEEISYAPESTI